ncbi:MAG TPA: hypothetical protein VGS04_01105 [Nitrososphaerales archaeon]|nr:hypothetical protein [Nitrososphaerales archaeon]
MKLERGEIGIVVVQFAALVSVVLLLSNFSPGQSAQSTPVIGSVYWGASSQGFALAAGKTTTVAQNESVVTAYFTVAFSTQVTAVSGSRICEVPNSSVGQSLTYTLIPFTYDKSKGSGTIPLSPTGQSAGWVCTYTIKVTDSLSQTTTWLGSVELK